mmetsp:Transcript_128603/g.222173  ORF Transcript_128603/g.222173 Transcript_128603/m.222173 type:complete len:148 (-) Transcript_128603:766-1209(-)
MAGIPTMSSFKKGGDPKWMDHWSEAHKGDGSASTLASSQSFRKMLKADGSEVDVGMTPEREAVLRKANEDLEKLQAAEKDLEACFGDGTGPLTQDDLDKAKAQIQHARNQIVATVRLATPMDYSPTLASQGITPSFRVTRGSFRFQV